MDELTTYAQVDLGALERNLAAIRQHTGRPVLLPVKANAYGHGIVPVGVAATTNGWADWLGVATVSEGVELVEAGVTAPILKLSGTLPNEIDTAVAHGLRLAITDLAGVDSAQAAAAQQGVIARLHLKIDSGMHRIGVDPAVASDVAERIEKLPNVELEGVFTHFAVSDTPAEDAFTAEQLTRFCQAVDAITARIGRRPIVHAANSGAVLAHPDAWFDMVRPGILSYGYYPDHATPKTVAVEPVMSLVTHLTYVKTVAAGETVSYGRTWAPETDTRVGTFPVGYGDGYDRRLSNQIQVIIDGQAYPQVGRVCMDQSMVDLGPGSLVAQGQRVTLMGREGDVAVTADDMADLLGTISYEILCRVAHRVPRVYVGGRSA